ncbi:hypothetical protein RRG08_036527 [Elysia crispata]|uniref:Uncharacterized protein n=1 Tax=Elysia crispata TaxID=231223 RepID=A0AAE0YWA6_9GAST|nr:hypothetical protein RRG08_036527 [Elysia crispata]
MLMDKSILDFPKRDILSHNLHGNERGWFDKGIDYISPTAEDARSKSDITSGRRCVPLNRVLVPAGFLVNARCIRLKSYHSQIDI